MAGGAENESDSDDDKHFYDLATKTKTQSFGLNFVWDLDEYKKHPPVSHYRAITRTETHLIVISKRNLAVIKQRVFKKQEKDIIKFLKSCKQLEYVPKRPLLEIWKKVQTDEMKNKDKTVIRNHHLIKEGEPAESIFIIKQGNFQANKRVLDYRVSDA